MDNGFEDFRRVCKVQFMPLADQTLMWDSAKDKRKGRAEYVWIDSTTIRSKTLMISRCLDEISELLLGEASPTSTLRPVAIFDDISLHETDVLVLCEVDKVGLHHGEKKREAYRKIVLSENAVKAELRFEIEQEFVFKQCVDMKNFSVGKARKVTQAFIKACYNALIPVQTVMYKDSKDECWSYKFGPCSGRQAADMLWMSRYIIKRVSEDFDLTVTFEPLNSVASGDHPAEEFRPSTKYRFSSEKMRNAERSNAITHMDAARDKLVRHGAGIEDFYGEGCRSSTDLIRIPNPVEKSQCVEDGRPAGYSDPYDVIGYIVKTCFLSEFWV